MDLNPFKNLLREKSGINLPCDREGVLTDAIQEGMKITKQFSSQAYYRFIINHNNEFLNFVNRLTINETYFFREPRQIKLFSEYLIPELLKKYNNIRKIRILSAGCSTGEEPYTLAMEIMEKFGTDADFFSIFAVDIDTDAIKTAEKGIYRKHSFRGFKKELFEKYFKKIDDSSYEVLNFLRKKVKFCNLNLLNETYPNLFSVVDIIFYRNVSIYFMSDTLKRVFANLSKILNNNGYLIVGASESFFHNIGILSLIERNGIFFYKKVLDINVKERRKIQPSFNIKKPDRRNDSRILFDDALNLAIKKNYTEALKKINYLLDNNKPFTNAYTLKASILINLHKISEAKEISLKSLELDKWHIGSYVLLAIIARMRNDSEEIIKRCNETLYIKPSCWLPHYYLAEIFHSGGEFELASREYKIVLRLLENGNTSKEELIFFPLFFSVDHYLNLCRHNLRKLKNGE